MNTLQFLIIDDDQVDRAIYQRILKQSFEHPYQVLEARTAAEGLELVKHEHFDCILLDYQLPDMLGSNLVPILKKQVGRFVPIVMLTGQGSEELAVSVMKTGVVDYISKVNLDPLHLARTIKFVVKQARLKKIIHEQKKKIQFYTFYDSLTGLKNRHTFEEMANMTFVNAVSFLHSLSIILIDIDNFMTVNDTYGFLVGNDILIQLSDRIQAIVPKNTLVGRFGEDEFAILLTDNTVEKLSHEIANQILMEIQKPYLVVDQEVHIKASMGIASYRESMPDFAAMLKQAYSALLRSKKEGGGTLRVY